MQYASILSLYILARNWIHCRELIYDFKISDCSWKKMLVQWKYEIKRYEKP